MILTVTLNAAIDKRYRMKKLRLGEVNRVSQCQCSAGGKGLNVARVAAIAGESVTAFGLAGGHTGKLLEELAGKDEIRQLTGRAELSRKELLQAVEQLGKRGILML